MLGLIQRVSSASVSVDGGVVASIGPGLLVLVGIEKDDTQESADRLLKKILAYRIFPDGEGKMNLSVADTGGEVLLVSQFTLAADTNRGLRPSFSSAKPPEEAQRLFDYFTGQAGRQYDKVASGAFGADMQVALVNDGPVTFMLRS